MFFKDDDTLEKMNTNKILGKEKYRDSGTIYKSQKNKDIEPNPKIINFVIGILITIFVIFLIIKVGEEKNPLIGIWTQQNRNLPNSYIIEFTKDKVIKQGMSYKVNYEIYNDKVEVKIKIGMIESPIGEVYYIKDKNTIIEQSMFGQRLLNKIK